MSVPYVLTTRLGTVAAHSDTMNFKHAIGFMIVGAVLGALPTLAPGLCAPTGVGGSSTRELWLEVMSTVLITIAMTCFARRILSSLGALLEYTPARAEAALELPAVVEPQPGVSMIPMHASVRRIRPRTRLPLPVATLDAGLLEPRRAA